MLFKLLKNDLKANRVQSAVITAFVMLAALLVSLAGMLLVDLLGAVDHLMDQAQSPAYIQMHKGSVDSAKLAAFAKTQPGVEDWQAFPFVTVQDAHIQLGQDSLQGSIQDNGLVTQNARFDFLLGMDDEVIVPKPGEVYLPMVYLAEGRARVGDLALIAGRQLRVAGFHRDSTMNSNLAMSKRLLMHEADFAALRAQGVEETIIEFRLKKGANTSALEAAYRAAGLPADGPTLSGAAIRMLNTINEGLLIAMLFLVSGFLIVVAFLCVRLTVLSQMEESLRQVGVMKAIGMRHNDIRRLFAARYGALSLLAAMLGFLLSLALRVPLGSSIRLQLGAGGSRATGLLLGAALSLLSALVVMLYVQRLLKRLRKLSASQALRGVQEDGQKERVPRPCLSASPLPLAPLLAVNDLRTRRRQYALLLAVLLCSVLLMTVPQALSHTLFGRGFVTNMGLGDSDLRIDLQTGGEVAAQTQEVLGQLEKDPDVQRFTALVTHMFTASSKEGEAQPLLVELGDHDAFPLTWLSGQAPKEETDIALSRLSAEELQVKLGDALVLTGATGERTMRVCAIYADITNGGKTAKAAFVEEETPALYSVIPVALKDGNQASKKAEELLAQFPQIRVAAVEVYLQKLFGATLKTVRVAATAALISGLLLAFLITFLFLHMLVIKDRRAIAIQRALGRPSGEIARQYLWRAGLVLALAVLLGMLMAGPISTALGGLLVAAFGGGSIAVRLPTLWAFLAPLGLALVAWAAARLGSSGISSLSLQDSLKEQQI